MVRRRWVVAPALTGLVLTWIGGYVRASQNSVCLDGVNPRDGRCYGTFTSDAWQVTGLIALGVGIVLMLLRTATRAKSAPRRTHCSEPRPQRVSHAAR